MANLHQTCCLLWSRSPLGGAFMFAVLALVTACSLDESPRSDGSSPPVDHADAGAVGLPGPLEGVLSVDGLPVQYRASFVSETGDTLASFDLPSGHHIEAWVSASGRGELIIDGRRLDGYGARSPQDIALLQTLSEGSLGRAIVAIPLSVGCEDV